MKTFAIKNRNDKELILGYVLYYEKTDSFNIELMNNVDENKLPLVLDIFYHNKVYSINSYYSEKFLQLRVIPKERQNITSILKEAKLENYNLYQMLMLNKGRCTNDDAELVLVDDLPKDIKNRFKRKIKDVIPIKNNKVLVFFRNGEAKKVDIQKLKQDDRLYKNILVNKDVFNNVKLQNDGYGIRWGESLLIDYEELYKKGKSVDIELDDFDSYVNYNVIDTNGVCEILNCTRQNVDDLQTRGTIKPIKEYKKSKLFIKREIEERKFKK